MQKVNKTRAQAKVGQASTFVHRLNRPKPLRRRVEPAEVADEIVDF